MVPVAQREVMARVPARTSKRSGAGNTIGSRLAATVADAEELALAELDAAELKGTAVQRSMKATGGIRRMPSSIALPAKPGSARRSSSWSGCWSSSRTAFAIVDSTVSIAPNRITRSCATISSSESPRAGSLATALVIELSGRVARAPHLLEQDRVECVASRIGAPLGLGIAVVDHGAGERLVELLHACDIVEREAEHVAGEPDRERRREVLDQLAAADRGELGDQRVDAALHRLGEALAHRAHAERLVEGPPLPLVLGAVARQHHHAERRAHEVGLGPDREVVARLEQLARERVRRDEPAAERRHPRDRLEVAQAVERTHAAVPLEVGELDGAADREARAAARRSSASSTTTCGISWPIRAMLLRRRMQGHFERAFGRRPAGGKPVGGAALRVPVSRPAAGLPAR